MKDFLFPILCSIVGIVLTAILIVYSIIHYSMTDDWAKAILVIGAQFFIEFVFIGIVIICRKEARLQNKKYYESNTYRRF